MKKKTASKVNMKTLSAKIVRVNKELDEICDLLALLKAEKKGKPTVAKKKTVRKSKKAPKKVRK